ncbi:hypothetical protein OK074_8993, partial [Actinobacteria bacterium OK074]
MPTPHGPRGALAFGAEELRVLRRALALALHPRSAPVSAEDPRDPRAAQAAREDRNAQDLQDCLRLAESVDEAIRESTRLRAFLLADLARYRAALPGTVSGYLALLQEALNAGYRPVRDDLAALGALRGNATAAALLARCEARRTPSARPRLLAIPGGRSPVAVVRQDATGNPGKKPPAPRPRPATPDP